MWDKTKYYVRSWSLRYRPRTNHVDSSIPSSGWALGIFDLRHDEGHQQINKNGWMKVNSELR